MLDAISYFAPVVVLCVISAMVSAQPAPPDPLPEGFRPPQDQVDEALAIFDAYPKQAGLEGWIGPEEVEAARKRYRTGDIPFDKPRVDYWMSKSDRFVYDMIPRENPRSIAVSYKEGCPLHLGRHRTMRPVWGEPDTFRCDIGGETWRPGMMVKNPTTGEMVEVTDDGLGWQPPEGFPQQGRFYFKGAYRMYQIRMLISFPYAQVEDFDGPTPPRGDGRHDHQDGANHDTVIYQLAWAHAVTGEQAYADRALLILNRLAENYRWYNSQVDTFGDRRFNKTRAYIHSELSDSFYLRTLVAAYDLIFNAIDDADNVLAFFRDRHGADYDGDGRTTTDDLKYNIEHNLFGYGWEFLRRSNARFYQGNKRQNQLHAMMQLALVFRNDRIMQHALEGPRGFRHNVVGCFYRDGRSHEDASGYAWFTNKNFLNMGAVVHRFQGRDIYSAGIELDPALQNRLSSIAQWQWLEDCDGRALNYGHAGNSRDAQLEAPEGEMVGTLLGHEVGLTIMRQGLDYRTRKHVLLYHSNGGRGHGNLDQLMLLIIGFGYDFSADLGYPASPHSAKRHAWTDNTITHPTVLVDAMPQREQSSASAELYAGASWVQATAAWSENAYPQTQLYHRTAVVVEVDDDRHFVIDVFRIVGGGQHDYAFHSLGGDDAANFDITCDNQLAARPGTLAGEDVPFAAESENGYSYIRDIREGHVSDSFTATWRVGDDAGSGYSLHMLGDTNRTVVTGVGEGKGVLHRSPLDPYLIVRQGGEEQSASTFIAVHEPFQGDGLGLTLEPLAVPGATTHQMAAGLRITTRDGEVFRFRSALHADWRATDRYTGGQRLVLEGPQGRLAVNAPTPRREGRIVDIDYPSRQVTIATEADLGDAAGQVLYVHHPDYVKATAFDIESVQRLQDDRWRITTRRSALLATNAVERIDADGRIWSPDNMGKLNECPTLFDGKMLVTSDARRPVGRIAMVASASEDDVTRQVVTLNEDSERSAAPEPNETYAIYDIAPGDRAYIPTIRIDDARSE